MINLVLWVLSVKPGDLLGVLWKKHQKCGFTERIRIWQGVFKSNCIPVVLWGQEVLDKLANISKDDKIWTVGKLELLDNSVLKEIGHYINPNDLEKSGNRGTTV